MLAVEQPQSVILNYAPGPLDTPMIDDLLADQKTDPGKAKLLNLVFKDRQVPSIDHFGTSYYRIYTLKVSARQF